MSTLTLVDVRKSIFLIRKVDAPISTVDAPRSTSVASVQSEVDAQATMLTRRRRPKLYRGVSVCVYGGGTNRTRLGVGGPDKVILSGLTVRLDAAPIRPHAPPIGPDAAPIGPNTPLIGPDTLSIRLDAPPIGPNAPLSWDGWWACQWVSVEHRWKWSVCVSGVVGEASVERRWSISGVSVDC